MVPASPPIFPPQCNSVLRSEIGFSERARRISRGDDGCGCPQFWRTGFHDCALYSKADYVNLRVPFMQRTKLPFFRTRRAVERYFGGKTIKCLLCGGRFRRLSFHLAAKHGVTTDDYKSRFGLAWSRGLTSAPSHANSGWDDDRKAKASKLARRSRFFKLAHPAPRREPALFLKLEAVKNLGTNAVGFGKEFESRVRVLFRRGCTDAAIAQVLNVNRLTVNKRTKRWRKRKL